MNSTTSDLFEKSIRYLNGIIDELNRGIDFDHLEHLVGFYQYGNLAENSDLSNIHETIDEAVNRRFIDSQNLLTETNKLIAEYTSSKGCIFLIEDSILFENLSDAVDFGLARINNSMPVSSKNLQIEPKKWLTVPKEQLFKFGVMESEDGSLKRMGQVYAFQPDLFLLLGVSCNELKTNDKQLAIKSLKVLIEIGQYSFGSFVHSMTSELLPRRKGKSLIIKNSSMLIEGTETSKSNLYVEWISETEIIYYNTHFTGSEASIYHLNGNNWTKISTIMKLIR
jgi:hypothetical protein